MRRREFIAGAISLAAGASHVEAQAAGASRRLAIFSPSESSALMGEKSDNRYYRALFEELRRLGHVEGQNLTVEKYGSEQNKSGAAALMAEIISSNPDVVVVIGPGATCCVAGGSGAGGACGRRDDRHHSCPASGGLSRQRGRIPISDRAGFARWRRRDHDRGYP